MTCKLPGDQPPVLGKHKDLREQEPRNLLSSAVKVRPHTS